MKILLVLLLTAVIGPTFAQDTGAIDAKIVALLVKESDAVVRCHKESSGHVGMPAEMAKRYGLPVGEHVFSLKLKETVAGEEIAVGDIQLVAHRTDGPLFLAEGDYLVFVKKLEDESARWVLVAGYFGIQPFAGELEELVKKSFNEKGL